MRPVRIAASFSVASTLLVAPAWGQEQAAAAAAWAAALETTQRKAAS